MIKIIEDKEGKAIISVAIVEITSDDWTQLTAILESKHKAGEKIHWYFELEDFTSDSQICIPDSHSFTRAFEEGFERIAVVGSQEWHGWLMELVKPFNHAQVQFFETIDQAKAHQWIRNN